MDSMVTYLEPEEKMEFYRYANLADVSASELNRILIRRYLKNRTRKQK